jgi:5-enolpyruvylshikimate-3-phosphate synthase
VKSLRVKAAAKPLAGNARAPGDKSIGHRAIMLAALGSGPSRISGLSFALDNQRTMGVLRALGVSMLEREGVLEVDGAGLDGLLAPQDTLDCGNSGTSMRLLMGILAGQPFTSVLDGDNSLRTRPMARVARPLATMGAEISGRGGTVGGEIYAPLQVVGRRPLRGLDHQSPVASAQVKSALLLAGLWAVGPVRIREPGPSRDHTERMLRALGVPLASPSPRELVLDPRGWSRELPARNWHVPGDISSAAFLLVAVRAIDEIPILAVAATQARGTTVVRDAAELRVKESDRIAKVARELGRLGARIRERPDGFEVDGPTTLLGGTVSSGGDHRIAMACAVAGLLARRDVVVEDAANVETSFVEFEKSLAALGADIVKV